MTGKLSAKLQGRKSVFLQGEDAVTTLQSVYPPETAWSLVPEDIDECRIVMEVALALQALTTMVDRMYAMRKSGEAAQRARAYDTLQGTAIRLAVQIYDTWEPPFEIPDSIYTTGGQAENVNVPRQPTVNETTVAPQQAQRDQQAAALPVAL